MEDKDRIQYKDGSSLPHFEGDLHTITLDEAKQLVLRSYQRRVAKVIVPELHKFLFQELYFRGVISAMVQEIAESILGRDRPLSEDDEVYYALCDYLFNTVANRIEACAEDIVSTL